MNFFKKKNFAVREYEPRPVCKILGNLIEGIKSYKKFRFGGWPPYWRKKSGNGGIYSHYSGLLAPKPEIGGRKRDQSTVAGHEVYRSWKFGKDLSSDMVSEIWCTLVFVKTRRNGWCIHATRVEKHYRRSRDINSSHTYPQISALAQDQRTHWI